ncbi:hypothetical protein BC628DRAFT_1323570 [Trametes gibbosa]|nr:hypothetical protein BC628DRAFT_1323570 [Trametes gibbosa]
MDVDDYFDDDFVLDAAALAAIDNEETKFKEAQRVTQQQQQPQPVAGQRRPADATLPVEPPPLKRQKVSHNPAQGEASVSSAFHHAEDDEGLPEISVIGAGSYRFPAAQRAAANALAAQLRDAQITTTEAPQRLPSPVRDAPHAPAAPASRNSSAARSGVAAPLANVPRPVPIIVNSTVQPREPQSARISRRSTTLQSIQAALAGFTPTASYPTATVGPAVPPPIPLAPSRVHRNSVSSRGVSPAIPPRVSPAPQPSQSRAGINAPVQGPSRLTRHPSTPPTTVTPAHRRQSVPGASRPHATPSVHATVFPPQPQPSQGQNDRRLKLELDTLRAQFEQLLKANEETRKAVGEERTARYAKEGEVSILRKNMEKTAKDHAAEVARIKAAREMAEAAQAQLRKEMAEERERLRTELVFKRHELETSHRKTPHARNRRFDNQVPFSPSTTATQRRQGTAAGSGQYGGLSNVFETPSRPRIGRLLPNSPERPHKNGPIDSPPKKPVKLPGFYNAFDPSPLKENLSFSQQFQSTPANAKDKGKLRIDQPSFGPLARPAEDEFFNPTPTRGPAPAHPLPPSPPLVELQEQYVIADTEGHTDLSGPSSSVEPTTSAAEEDAEMKDEAKLMQPHEPAEPLLTPDWVQELQRIVLTHKCHGQQQPTLQMLMNCSLPASTPTARAQEYSMQSAELLESLGMAADKLARPDDMIHTVEQRLSAMGRILCSVGSVAPLTALLDLVKVAALFVPSFVPLALSPIDSPPALLLMLCETVQRHLTPKGQDMSENHGRLASEVLSLLEVVFWYTPTDFATQLSVFIRKKGVLSTLFDPSQPTWLLLRTIRALTLAASYHVLWKSFLSFPFPETPQEEAAANNFARIPHIEQLASFLIDRTRDGPECRPLRYAIFNLVTTLAVAHADSLFFLLQSHTLLPSIIVFLHNITVPLWEEHEAFMADIELITWTIQTVKRTVLLLHYLMTKTDSLRINLRQKLMLPPKRFSNSLWHIFTVSLGRLSYACPPDWLGIENLQTLDQIYDMAKEVLEVVVDGPELESIWAAFQVDDNVPNSPRTTQYDEDEDKPGSGDAADTRGAVHSVIEID